jgi:cytochrome c peroxidase
VVVLAVAFVFLQSATANGVRSGSDNGQVDIEYWGRRLSPSAPEVVLGDRLFFETRFAEYFMANFKGDVNAALSVGDAVVDELPRPGHSPLRGPFRGQSISCRHCHLGDDFAAADPLAQRTYCDFTARSAIPPRDDHLTHTVRNSPGLIDLGLTREAPFLLHFDGEFATAEDLVIDTLTGRNMGWLSAEQATARSHIARVIREDNGTNPRNVKWDNGGAGIPYRIAMLGTDPSIPARLRIPPEYRVDVLAASDEEVLQRVARLIHAYLDSLRFGVEDTFREAGSPYDLFLAKNKFPLKPDNAESSLAYARRLLGLINRSKKFEWVTAPIDGQFQLHNQRYEFGETELAGLKVFLTESSVARAGIKSAGNCVACHTPPRFTDHRFHNTGVSQFEYDALFGAGAFAGLEIPEVNQRNSQPEKYFPASTSHPYAEGRFRSIPSIEKPGFADLGVWNIFANPDFPKPQAPLSRSLCGPVTANTSRCAPESVLPKTIALFKTPTVRDLGHSEPYFHSGQVATIEGVLRHYRKAADLARAGRLRNGSPELRAVHIGPTDVPNLAAFLRALNEDYH